MINPALATFTNSAVDRQATQLPSDEYARLHTAAETADAITDFRIQRVVFQSNLLESKMIVDLLDDAISDEQEDASYLHAMDERATYRAVQKDVHSILLARQSLGRTLDMSV